jgi:fructokinase
MPDVVCMGELLVDFVATGRNVPIAASPGFVRAPGGAPANVAVALNRLGLSSRFVGKVGSDPFGDYLRGVLADAGVDTRYLLSDASARTTAAFAAVWDDGRKEFFFYRNPGADMMLNAEEIVPEILAGARCFHYGSITLASEPAAAAQRKATALARDLGLMITYDPNYRPTLWPGESAARETIREAFSHCHMAKVSDEEWEIATGERTLEAGIEAILAKGVELVVISRGAAGAVAATRRHMVSAPAWQVPVVETTGAGDGFLAGMVARLLPERERLGSLALVDKAVLEESLSFANAVGAITCTRPGAIPALPSLAEVMEFLKTAKPAASR